MVLDNKQKSLLIQCLDKIPTSIIFKVCLGQDGNSKEMASFLDEVAGLSPKIVMELAELTRTPSFGLSLKGKEAQIEFAGIPLNEEFDSFILALWQVTGQSLEIEFELLEEVKGIDKRLHFETYVSLTCHNCSTVVKSLNLLASLNPNITHTMIEGKMFQDERRAKGILTVPTILLNGEEVAGGRQTLEQLVELAKGSGSIAKFEQKEVFDVLIIGGGPAGNSAAIYSARKGIKTGMIADLFGGKVKDIPGIGNMIGIPFTQGSDLMENIEQHLNQYYVDMMKDQLAISIQKNELIEVALANGALLKAKTAILSVGVTWEKLEIPGEEEFRSKGVANCPHCDGPLFAGQAVAVVGGGNPAIEGVIDLAGTSKHVYVFSESKIMADQILQERLLSLPNVTIFENSEVTEITGVTKVNGLKFRNHKTKEEQELSVTGVFVQTGLVPNTTWLRHSDILLNEQGEIVTNREGMTNLAGIFAAGDCTDSPYKQIIISMGSGATAALGAFNYLIRQD